MAICQMSAFDDRKFGNYLDSGSHTSYILPDRAFTTLRSNFRRPGMKGAKRVTFACENNGFEGTIEGEDDHGDEVPSSVVRSTSQDIPKTDSLNNNNLGNSKSDYSPPNGVRRASPRSSSSRLPEQREPPTTCDNAPNPLDIGGYLSVKFHYDEDSQPGERIQYGRTVLDRANQQSGIIADATDLTCMAQGRVLVTDMLSSRLQVILPSGSPVLSYVIEGVTEPWATAVASDGLMAVTSRRNKSVTLIAPNGQIRHTFGKEIFASPCGVAFDSDNRLVIADSLAQRIFVFSTSGELLHIFDADGALKNPQYVTVSPRGEIVVSDAGNHSVLVLSADGRILRQMGRFGKEDGCLKSPQGVCTDSLGNILVCDHYNDRVSVFSSRGQFVRHLLTSLHGLGHPQGLALSPDLRLYVSHGKSKATMVTIFDLQYGVFV